MSSCLLQVAVGKVQNLKTFVVLDVLFQLGELDKLEEVVLAEIESCYALFVGEQLEKSSGVAAELLACDFEELKFIEKLALAVRLQALNLLQAYAVVGDF